MAVFYAHVLVVIDLETIVMMCGILGFIAMEPGLYDFEALNDLFQTPNS